VCLLLIRLTTLEELRNQCCHHSPVLVDLLSCLPQLHAPLGLMLLGMHGSGALWVGVYLCNSISYDVGVRMAITVWFEENLTDKHQRSWVPWGVIGRGGGVLGVRRERVQDVQLQQLRIMQGCGM
jgi:hypothetical protein